MMFHASQYETRKVNEQLLLTWLVAGSNPAREAIFRRLVAATVRAVTFTCELFL